MNYAIPALVLKAARVSYPNPKARPEQDTQYIPLTQQNHSNVCTGTLLCTNTAVTGRAGWQPFEQLLTQRNTQKLRRNPVSATL